MGTICTVASSLSEATHLKHVSELWLTSLRAMKDHPFMPYESSCTRSSAYDLSDYDEWSGRCWLTSDRALTNLVLSGTNRCCGPGDSYFLKSLGRANGFPALPPDGFICCIFRLTLLL